MQNIDISYEQENSTIIQQRGTPSVHEAILLGKSFKSILA